MKASELMIGDWVRLTKGFNRGNSYKVLAIYENGSINTKYNSPVLLGDYEPIPLTEKILKKNGVKYLHLYENDFPDSPERRICIREYRGIQFEVLSGTMPLKYVHELQHALRLCGLSELADNFKVE